MDNRNHVLLIEDDLVLQQVMMAYFQIEGIELTLAENGVTGLQLFKEKLPTVVVTDLRMPGMDGLEVVAAIGEANSDVPVIVMSGMGSMDDSIEALRCGAWDFLEKPCKPTDLIHAVKKAFEHANLVRENRNYHDLLEAEVKKRTIELENELERRRVAEHALFESEQKFRAIFDQASHFILLTDINGILLEVNNTTRDFMNCNGNKVLDTELWKMKWWKGEDEICHQIEREIKNAAQGNVVVFETKVHSPNNHYMYIDFTLKPVINSSGEVIMIIAEGHDITNHKKVESELIEAKEIAELSNEVKSQFLSNMSHEIRTPMHWILSYSKFGLEKCRIADREKIHSFFAEINEGGARLMTLLDNLLDLSKMESGEMKYDFVNTDIYELTHSIKIQTALFLDEKELTIEVKNNAMSTEVKCDSQRIRQVINNYISNAIKFSPNAGHIIVELGKDDKNYIFSIIDEGCGVPPGELETIFDKFLQSSNTITGAGGTGLGLAICRDIISAHNGETWAVRNHPKGTRFTFTLPLHI